MGCMSAFDTDSFDLLDLIRHFILDTYTSIKQTIIQLNEDIMMRSKGIYTSEPYTFIIKYTCRS